MILTFGSSRRAASQSVVTSGSSADVVMIPNSSSSFRDALLAQARNPYSLSWLWIPGSLALLAPSDAPIGASGNDEGAGSLQATRKLTLRLLRLEFLDRAAGVAPGGESAADMGDRL